MVAVLAHRLLIGVFIGAMASRADPEDKANRRRQTACLVAVSTCFLMYIIIIRPYHVPLANFFEAVVLMCQIAVVSRNFWFLDADESIGGVEVSENSVQAANTIYYIMLISIACMLLRVVAVMIPTWCRVPILAKLLFHHIPKLEARKRHRSRKNLLQLEKAVRNLSSRTSLAGCTNPSALSGLSGRLSDHGHKMRRVRGPPGSAAERGRQKLKRAVRKLGAAQALSAFKDGDGGTRWTEGWQVFDYKSPHRRRMGYGKMRRSTSSSMYSDDSDADLLGAFDNSIRQRRHTGRSSGGLRFIDGKGAKLRKGKAAAKKKQAMVAEVKRKMSAAKRGRAKMRTALRKIATARAFVHPGAFSSASLQPRGAGGTRASGRKSKSRGLRHRGTIQWKHSEAEALRNEAAALAHEGDYEGAAEARRRAVRLDPQDVGAQCALGAALAQTGDLDGALDVCAQAVQLGPNESHAHQTLGQVLAEKGDIRAAILAQKRALELDDGNAAAHSGLGAALIEVGDTDGALAETRRAVELDPHSAAANTNLGKALAARGDMDEALVRHRKAVSLAPGSASAHTHLGAALVSSGEVGLGMAHHKRAIKLRPKEPLPHHNLGIALVERGDFEEAVAEHERAVALQPRRSLLRFGLGQAHRRAGNLGAAISAFEEAVALDPFDREAAQIANGGGSASTRSKAGGKGGRRASTSHQTAAGKTFDLYYAAVAGVASQQRPEDDPAYGHPTQAIRNAQALADARVERARAALGLGVTKNKLKKKLKKKKAKNKQRGTIVAPSTQRKRKTVDARSNTVLEHFMIAHGDDPAQLRKPRKLSRAASFGGFHEGNLDVDKLDVRAGTHALVPAGRRSDQRRLSIGSVTSVASVVSEREVAPPRIASIDPGHHHHHLPLMSRAMRRRQSVDAGSLPGHHVDLASLKEASRHAREEREKRKQALLEKRRKHRERARRRRASVIATVGDLRKKKPGADGVSPGGKKKKGKRPKLQKRKHKKHKGKTAQLAAGAGLGMRRNLKSRRKGRQRVSRQTTGRVSGRMLRSKASIARMKGAIRRASVTSTEMPDSWTPKNGATFTRIDE